MQQTNQSHGTQIPVYYPDQKRISMWVDQIYAKALITKGLVHKQGRMPHMTLTFVQ